jgi:hypothetical protein
VLLQLSFIFLLTLGAFAQTTTGRLTGAVLDPSMSRVPNATVRAINDANGFRVETKTGREGQYVLLLLPIGPYRIEVEAAGFAREIVTGLVLQVDQILRINIQLQPASVAQEITVTAEPPLVDTESGAKGTVIENKRIVDMPLNGRQFLELVKLTPGVTQNAGGSLRAEFTGNLAGPAITVNGARESDNFFSIDGVGSNDRFYNSPTVLPSIDAVAEFKVQSSSYAAESGGQGGANINLQIKSGTDNVHGSLFHFFRNNKLDARNSFDLLNSRTPGFQQNQYGATAGGPIQKSKTHAFASWEGLRIRKTVTQLQTVPTTAMRSGDFREVRAPGAAIGRVIDPLTGQEFATQNVIPRGRIDPTAQRLLNLIPLPNRGSGVSLNYVAQPKEENTTDQGIARVDRYYNERNRVYGRLVVANALGFNPMGTRNVLGNPRVAVPGFGNSIELNSRNAAMIWTRTFSSRLLGEGRLGYNRVSGGQLPQNAGNNFAREANLSGIPDLKPDYRGYPRFSVAGYPEFGDIEFNIVRRNNEYSGEYLLSYVRPRHNYKLGGFYRRVQFAPQSFQIPRGQYQFGGATTGAFSGNALADFLMGHPDTVNLATIDEGYMSGNEYAWFAQTDWRTSRKLTINLGIRYEFFGTLHEKYDRMSTFDPATRTFIVSSHDGKPAAPSFVIPVIGYSQKVIAVTNPAGTFRFPVKTTEELDLPRGIIKNDRNNWAPRFGFAFDPFANGKNVIRGGYGIFYSRPMYSTRALLSTQPPYSNRFQRQFASAGTLSAPVTIANAASSFPVPTLINTSQFPDVNFRTGYLQQWNLTLERALPGNLLLSFTYAGSKGTKLFSNRLYNYPRPGAEPGGNVPANRGANVNVGIPGGPTGFTGGPPPEIRVQGPAFLRFDALPEAPGLFYTFQMTSNGFSNYHSGSVRLEKRFAKGLTMDTSYTWAKSLDNDSLGIPVADSSASDQNPFDKSLEKARSSFDVRQRFVASFAYDLPLGRTAGLRDWQIGGIIFAETGLPFTVNLNGDYYGIGSSRRGRPDLVGNPNNGPKTTDRWFDTSAFVLPPVAVTSFPFLFVPGPDFLRRSPTPLGNFGTAGRNIVDSDNVATANLSLLKNVRMRERVTVQLRAELFNILNHANYGFPNREFLVPPAQVILNPTWDRRTLNPDFGKITNTRIDSRQIQFAIKVLF